MVQFKHSERFFKIRDFRDILRVEFAERRNGNPSYSLRAFARDLGSNPGTFSGILSGRYGISKAKAVLFADRLGLDGMQKQFFIDLVESQHARTELGRAQAHRKLEQYVTSVKFEKLNPEQTSLLEKWQYPATLEYISLMNGHATASKIGLALQISEDEAALAIGTLLRLGLITQAENGYVREKEFCMGEGETPSTVIRNFHRQLAGLSAVALENQAIEKRRHLSTIVGVDSKKVREAREWLDSAHQEFIDKFGTSESIDCVYGLGFQFFRIDQGTEEKNV